MATVTMVDVKAANPGWFSRGNKRFFNDVSYRVVNYRGKAYLARSTYGWTDMGGGKKRLHWRLNPLSGKLEIQPLVDREFSGMEDIRDWIKEQVSGGKPMPEPKASARTGLPKHAWEKLVKGGQGSFLDPPGHPEHDWSVHSVYGDTSSSSLSFAAEHASDPTAKAAARAKLAQWKPLPLSDPKVQDWIHEVLGYFKGMYSGMNKAMQQSWDVSDLRHRLDYDPTLNQDIHAGVHFIRKFYPDYKATPYDFQAAYWGKKPTRALAVVSQGKPELGPARLSR